MRDSHGDEARFDLSLARETVEDYAAVTGVGCRLLTAEGAEIFAARRENVCRELAAAVNRDYRCAALHGRAPAEAARFGGRYIYACPMGLVFFAAPIMAAGTVAGALVAGPVLLGDAEDALSAAEPGSDTDAARRAVSAAPRCDGRRVQALSRQLFASAVYLSDSGDQLLAARTDAAQASAIDDYIATLNSAEGGRVPYPMEKEQALYSAIIRGDLDTAGQLINQLLGHIYFYALDEEEIRVRVAELLTVMLRAGAAGELGQDRALALSRFYLREISGLRGQEELTRWLAGTLRKLTAQLFPPGEPARHSGAVGKAVDYMKRKYALRLTLEEVAEYAGYTPTYFSRIFREDTGVTFKEYLTQLRVEKAKTLLLTSRLSITEIGAMTGFADQSYFSRQFRLATGVTPDKYRKRSRRLDREKEYGRK